MSHKIEFKNICKQFRNQEVAAVDDFNLEIDDHEFIVIVGPSGCGKSTLLRMVAGLETMSEGSILIDGEVVNDVAPKDRDIAMVFQNYALYPHMSVFDNIAFGMKIRKFSKGEIEDRVFWASDILGLRDYLDRKPSQLSGGERQRVALGRAIVRHAHVFLMDEPLSNLDSKLRTMMRSEIRKLHDTLETTTLYVTHDQTEAMTMASRIVVMNRGRIQQVGTPESVYHRPENVFVASFIGAPPMNLLPGIMDDSLVDFGEFKYDLLDVPAVSNGDVVRVVLGVRPEHVSVSRVVGTIDDASLVGTVLISELLGSEQLVYVEFLDQQVVCCIESLESFEVGAPVVLDFDREHIHIFDADTGDILYRFM